MDSWKEVDKIAFEIPLLEIMYDDLSKETKATITFLQYAAFRNSHWSKWDILQGMIIAGERKKEATIWWEEQRNPTPSRSMQPCHSCKGPWELDHRCRGKDQECIIEACHDSEGEVCEDGAIDVDSEQSDDDSDSCTEASDSDSTSEDSDDDSCTEASDACTLEEEDGPCVVDRQLDGQDDSPSISTDTSHTIDDLTPQQSGDTSEESHVLVPRDDELPMGAMTHLTPVQTPMIATSDEEISGTSGMMDELSVRDAHHGQVDPQIQEEVQDVHVVDPTHTGQSEEMESQLLETPVVEQMAEVDKWMEHLLPGLDCMDEDALFGSQDDNSTCLDTTIWDPGADDSSKLSAQEDTTTHTGYSVSQGEMASSDGMQWHTGVPSGTVDSRQFVTLSSAESVVSDGTNSERHEGVPQHDYDQESHHLATQLGVSEAMIRVATRHIDDMHVVMTYYGWRASMA
jgi:hypothetical protein